MVLTNSQYNAIQREYDSKRLHNKHRMKQREAHAYEMIPALKMMEDELISNSVEAAKAAIMGDENAITEFRKKNRELSQCKKDLLTANGFAPDYLDPIYTCKDCKDTGFIGNEKCHCFKQAIVDIVYSQSAIKEIIKHENFQNFRYDYYSNDEQNEVTGLTPYENILHVVTECKEYIELFPTNYENLLIYGSAGVGKTFLVNSIANELLNRAVNVIYLTSYQLFDILGKSKFKRTNDTSNSEDSVSEDFIFECDLLIIDDLGTELNNSFTTSELYNCINERHLQKKSTIISTNLSPEELLANYSERISSRLIGNYKLLNIYGDDIRIWK